VLNAARWSNRFKREIRLYEHLLRDVFHIFAPSQDPAGHRKHPVLVAPNQLFKRLLVLRLRPPDQFPVVRLACRLENTPFGCRRRNGRLRGSTFGTRAIDIWLRLLSPDCRNAHHLFQFPGRKFLLATYLTDME